MRQTDTVMIYTPANVRTDGMYLSKDMALEAIPSSTLRKALCPRSRGNVLVCISECQAPCSFGRELMRRCGQNERNAQQTDTV